MSHAPHFALPGYSPSQVFFDGCLECEQSCALPDVAISRLDSVTFARAWKRAAEWGAHGLPDVSLAEAPMLRALWAVQVQLGRRRVALDLE